MLSGTVSCTGGMAIPEIRQKQSLKEKEQLRTRNEWHDRNQAPPQLHSHQRRIPPQEATQTDQIAPTAMSASPPYRSLIVTTKVRTTIQFSISTRILTLSGVGGWLTPGAPSNGGYLPLNINNTMNSSRDSVINLSTRSDTTPPTFRRRSFGASSNGINSPEALSTPSNARHSAMGALYARTAHGSVSPQSYFNNGTAARSTTSINSRRGSVMATRREAEETDSDDEIVMTSRH